LLHFVENAPWSYAAMLVKGGELVLPAVERSGPVEAWIIDDTGSPKEAWALGRGDPAILRANSGRITVKVAVTLSLANHGASLPVASQSPRGLGQGLGASAQGLLVQTKRSRHPAQIYARLVDERRHFRLGSGWRGIAAQNQGWHGRPVEQRKERATV
jgi:hypothetical protein